MKNPITTDQYICDECGNTSPVFNESCTNCGAPMAALDSGNAHKEPNPDSDLEETDYNSDGTESLQQLQEKEESEEDKPDSYGDDE